ncbi:protein of unknown function [Ralstonia solanacearum CFBP2957]|nr:protein of unknown function [Ralstonia solanacearum CFBP2957]
MLSGGPVFLERHGADVELMSVGPAELAVDEASGLQVNVVDYGACLSRRPASDIGLKRPLAGVRGRLFYEVRSSRKCSPKKTKSGIARPWMVVAKIRLKEMSTSLQPCCYIVWR